MPPRLFAVGLLALASAGCSGSDPAADPPISTADVAPLTDSSASSATTSTTAPAPPERDDHSLADGRHAGYLRSVDTGSRTMVVDVIQFLTGDAARDASVADGHGSDVPNDYYIRNVNPKLRTLAFAETVEVTVLDSSVGGNDAARSVPADIATLARVVQLRLGSDGPGPPFWVTVAGGRVTKVEEQYLP